jgi:hypothetical protein
MEHDIEKEKNLKLRLSAFEQLSALKINFHNSALFCSGEAQTTCMLNYLVASKASFLLGIWVFPIHYERLTNAECKWWMKGYISN